VTPEQAEALRLSRVALETLRYRKPRDGSEPARFCDHAVEPCLRCEAARQALAALAKLKLEGGVG
jgi:hypothetical protein